MDGVHATRVTCMLPVRDMARARRFYEQALGLEALGGRADGRFVLRCGDTDVALLPRPHAPEAGHTRLSFRVDDIEAEIRRLQANGVRFNDYDLPGLKTERHVATLGTERCAWFDDTEGNTLCLHEEH